MNRHELEQLKAQAVPRLAWQKIVTVTDGFSLSDEEQRILGEYFSQFVEPQRDADGNAVCICCRSVMRGGIEGWLLGGAPGSCTMDWGLVHGECFCSACGYPARAYHYKIGPIDVLRVTLQYHPDNRFPDQIEP
jgi:hypothetical protein